MAQVKRQVNDILDMWVNGATVARIASFLHLDPSTVEYVINQYGEDVV
jgi:hypothetical protein